MPPLPPFLLPPKLVPNESITFVNQATCCLLAFAHLNIPETDPVLGDTVAHAATSPHLYMLPYIPVQCYPPLRQLHFDFRGFQSRSYVTNITIAESNPDMELLTQHLALAATF